MFDFLKNLLKTSNDAQIKKLQKTVDQINALEPDIKKLTDDQIREHIDGGRRAARIWTRCCPRPTRWCARRVCGY